MQKFTAFMRSLNWETVSGLLFAWCVVGAWCMACTAPLIASDCGHPGVVTPMNWAAAAFWYVGGTVIVLALFTGVYLGDQAGQRQHNAMKAAEKTRPS